MILPLRADNIASVQLLSHVRLFVTPWTAAHQASLSITNSQSPPKPMSIESVMPSSHLISSSVAPFFCPQFPPASGSFPISHLFTSGGQIIGASASASVLPMNIQDWLVESPCYPRDSWVFSSTTVQNCLYSMLNLFYGPNLTSIHGYWRNHSFDKTDLCRQSDVSAF